MTASGKRDQAFRAGYLVGHDFSKRKAPKKYRYRPELMRLWTRGLKHGQRTKQKLMQAVNAFLKEEQE